MGGESWPSPVPRFCVCHLSGSGLTPRRTGDWPGRSDRPLGIIEYLEQSLLCVRAKPVVIVEFVQLWNGPKATIRNGREYTYSAADDDYPILAVLDRAHLPSHSHDKSFEHQVRRLGPGYFHRVRLFSISFSISLPFDLRTWRRRSQHEDARARRGRAGCSSPFRNCHLPIASDGKCSRP